MDLSSEDGGAFKLDFEGLHAHDTGAFFAMMKPPGCVMIYLDSVILTEHHALRSPIDLRQLSAHVPQTFRNMTAYAVESELKSRLERYENTFASVGTSQSGSSSTGTFH